MKCISLKKNCRACGWKNEGTRVEMCAECGADMHCGKSAVSGYTLCPSHGGPNPSHGFYGKGPMTDGSKASFNIVRLAAKYNQMQRDGVILSNRAAVDLIDTRIRQLLERVDVEEAPNRIKDLYEKWMEMNAQPVGSPEWLQAKAEIDDVFLRIYHDYAAWHQIFEALDLRSKTTEREVKALKEIKAIMTVQDGYELAAKLMAAVIRVIGDDPRKIKQAQYEFARIIGESSDRVGETDAGDDGGGIEEA